MTRSEINAILQAAWQGGVAMDAARANKALADERRKAIYADTAAKRAAAEELINRLPRMEWRTALELRYIGRYPIKDIARAIPCDERTVSRWICSAIRMLEKQKHTPED